MENQNSPQQQAADLRMMLDNEPPKQRSSRRSSRGTTLSDIDTMSYDELVAYISDSNSDFADEATDFDAQNSLYGSNGSNNSGVRSSRNTSFSSGDSTPKSLADELREEEERAKRAVPYSFASLGKKQPADSSKDQAAEPWSEKSTYDGSENFADSRKAALSALRTTTPAPQEYPEAEYFQPNTPQAQTIAPDRPQEEHIDNANIPATINGSNFDAEGYDSEGFDAEGFDRDGFDRDGFDKDNYDREGYDWEGFDCEGFDRDGFDRDGFDRDNYDREGYDWEGFDCEGFDRDGFDRDGFDRDNYDREGYDWEGYNQYGLDREGFDRNGFDSEGYDREGFNNEGFDREGFDHDGFDQYNYDREGYDWEGYDCEGYDYGGFDREGYDKEGYTRQDWEAVGYKFGPRGEFILPEDEQADSDANLSEPISEADNSNQVNEPVVNESPEASKSEIAQDQISPSQDEANEAEASEKEEELPEYNFAATPTVAQNKTESTTETDHIEQENISTDSAAAYDSEDHTTELSTEDDAPQQAIAAHELSQDQDSQQYEQEYIHQDDVTQDDESQQYEQEYVPQDDMTQDDDSQQYEQEYVPQDDVTQGDDSQQYKQEYAHQDDLSQDEESQQYEQDHAHQDDVTQDEESQQYEQEYAHQDDLSQDEESQQYEQEYVHQDDLSQDQDLQPEAQVPSAEPRMDVPLFEPEDKFGNMTSPWRYECDYAIDYISGSRRGQRIALLASELGDERSFTIGSPGERVNDIEVDEPTIANDQALLRYSNGRFTLINFQEDIKINKRIVTCGEQVNLMTGDEISLGNTTLVFSERCVSEALAEYSLDVVEGTETDLGKSFPLTKQRSSIGRDRNSDIPLTDQEISRHHCTLTFRAGKFFLQHRSDTNPTFINGVSVPAGGERQITAEDKIQISSRTVLQLVKH